jgi:serine/threonine protein kinase
MERAALTLSSAPEVVFRDGLGERRHVVDPTGHETLEVLSLRAELAIVPSFEFALRERMSRLASFRHASFGRVRSVERLSDRDATLAIVSERTPGFRLSDLVAEAVRRQVALDINAALCLVRQLLPAIATLHENARDVAHGAIGPERLIVTPAGRLFVVEYVAGAALEQLRYSRDRYWSDLRIAVPRTAGLSRFDHRVDVMQIGLTALSLILGRPLTGEEFPGRIGDLVSSAWAVSSHGGFEPLSPGLRVWLTRALQLDARSAFATAHEAYDELENVLSDSEYMASPGTLEQFFARYQDAGPEESERDASLTTSPTIESGPKPLTAVTRAPAPVLSPVRAPEPVMTPSAKPPRPAEIENPAFPLNLASASPIQSATPASLGSPNSLTLVPSANSASAASPVSPPNLVNPVNSPNLVNPPNPVNLVTPVNLANQGNPVNAVNPGDTVTVISSSDPDADMAEFAPEPTMSGASREWEDAEAAKDEHGENESGAAERPRTKLVAAIGAALVIVAATGFLGRRYFTGPPPAPVTTGTVTVNSNPEGAAVLVDGEARGKTPLTLTLEAGAHKVELIADGATRLIPISIAAGAETSQYIELPKAAPDKGQLQVRTEPSGAQVVVDGVARGASPATIADLAPGEHTVLVTGALGSVRQKVTVESGATASLFVPLEAPEGAPVSGWVSIDSPVELQVFESGRLIGTSRNDRIMVSTGRHEIEVGSDALGFRTTRPVQVAAGKVSPIKLDLPKGTLAVNAVPWAEVWIDGEKQGDTPIGNVSLTIGPHDVVFRHPELGEQHHTATVTLKVPARLSVDLRKK